MSDTSDLYTRLKNTSGAPRFFTYVTRHGRTLASGEIYNIFGNLQSQPSWNERKQASLERDILSGAITFLKNPVPILLDTTPDPALADPTTTATVAPTGGGATGGSLVAGHYRVSYTFYNEWGQTLAGGESADFTVGATNIPRVTLPAIPTGATGIKVYLSDTSVGAVTAGAAKKYYNKITSGTTLDMSSATWNEGTQAFAAAPAVPTANLTAGHTSRAVILTDDVLDTTDPSWGSTVQAGV
jgi:hypothetical protein